VSRSTVRTATALAGALLALGSLSGCAAGFNAATNKPYTPTNGSIVNVGKMAVRSVVVVGNENGSGQADLIAVFVNTGQVPDALTGITVQGADPVTVPGGTLNLPPMVNVPIGPDQPNRVLLEKLQATPGQLVKIVMTFRDAGTAEVTALVMTPTGLVSGG